MPNDRPPVPPFFCIDGRAAEDYSVSAALAHETIEELFETGSEELARHVAKTPVVISHPDQIFLADAKRINTSHRSSGSPLGWLWEKQFVRKAGVETLHRFRPADKLTPHHSCTLITTLLPPARRMPFFISRRNGHQYVVPSQQDQMLLETVYHIPNEQITVIRPGIRGYVHTAAMPKRPAGGLLFVLGSFKEVPDLKKRIALASKLFPQMPVRVLRLKSKKPFVPGTWLKTLRNTAVCFYLSSSPFDWGTLALETMYWDIPTVFLETNGALSELLPNSPLSMARFLISQPDLPTLQKETKLARQTLLEKRLFEKGGHASQYLQIYARLGKAMRRPSN